MRMRRKPNLTERLERRSHLLLKEPELLRGRWSEEFEYNELHIELGCGRGRFAAETAKASPDVFIAAVEKLSVAIVTALETADAQKIKNIRFINAPADNLTEYFADGEAARIYINFCDPWPGNRHAKRRLTHRRFLELYKQVLHQNGEVHFKTDNLQLFDFSLSEFESCGFRLLDVRYDLHKDGTKGIMTEYEQRFHDQGFTIYSAICAKRVETGET